MKKKCEINFIPLAARLHRSGFNVLMFDLRGHGESAPGRCAGGLNEDQDICGAVHYTIERVMDEHHLHPARDERVLPEDLVQRTPRVGVIGYGLGAAAVLAAVGRKKGGTEIYKVFNGDAEGGVGYIDVLPDEIKRLRFLVLLEPASLAGAVKGFLYPIPLGIIRMFYGLVDWMRQAQGCYPMDGARLNRFANQVNVPTMFMRGESDDWGTRNEVEELYAAIPAQKRFEVVAGLGRMKLLDESSDGIERILAFTREFSGLYQRVEMETAILAVASCSCRSSQTDPGPVFEGSSSSFSV
jgi:pimeloyl-ACP methyl ester carboxylesterase